jgi:hypothetical protein
MASSRPSPPQTPVKSQGSLLKSYPSEKGGSNMMRSILTLGSGLILLFCASNVNAGTNSNKYEQTNLKSRTPEILKDIAGYQNLNTDEMAEIVGSADILYAGYGVWNSVNDATTAVRNAYNNGQRTFLATNSLTGDPAVGIVKYLYIVWRDRGVVGSGIAVEHQNIGINVP